MNEMTPQEMLDDIHSALQAGLVELNDWETNFIESFEHKEVRTPKQRAAIKKIWDRIDA